MTQVSFDSVQAYSNLPIDPVFPHHVNDLTFHWSGIHGTAQHQLRYSYILEGNDLAWSPLIKENKVRFQNLRPGDYTFKVRAVGGNGLWSDTAAYSFTIRPPWWLSVWAYAFYATVAILAIWSFIHWRTRKTREKLLAERQLTQRLQQVDKLKDQFLANTSHELRTPLQGIIDLSESLVERVGQDDQKEDLSMIISSGKRLTNLVNGILDFSNTVSRVAAQSMPETGEIIATPSSIGRSGRIQILVVDDEPINQQVLKNHLSDENFQLTQAMNGEEAIKAVESGRHFDLVLLDIMMPCISGYQVCRKIRERYLPSELPVIMITAKNQVQDLVQGLGVGANDYLAKPFTKDEFLARVKTQLELHSINSMTGKFVPNEFLRTLGRERITDVALGDHAEREVTVLFADIRGYTALAETMTPEETYRFVNAFNGRLGPVIRRHKGFVNQYLGDAVMAIFPESPADALQAAIDIQKTIREYNEQRLSRKRRPIGVGIGIHTGALIMGIIGDEKRLDAATIADTVNTASRIESLTKHYGANILLTEESAKRTLVCI